MTSPLPGEPDPEFERLLAEEEAIESMGPALQMHDHIVLLVLSGSRLYGLEHADSDYDWRGVFITPTAELLGLNTPPDTIDSDDPDVTLYEIGKFVSLLTKANPNLLELLWAPEFMRKTQVGATLVDMRDAFLSEKGVRSSYKGFAQSQYKQLVNKKNLDGDRRAKLVRHMFRVAEQGIQLLQTGTMDPRVADRDRLFDLGEADLDTVEKEWTVVNTLLNHIPTDLPKTVDLDSIDSALRNIRLSNLRESK